MWLEKIISQTGSSLSVFMMSALPGSSWLRWATIEEQVNQDCLGQEGYFGFCPTCRKQKRCVDGFYTCDSPCQAWRRRCGGALAVTRLVMKSQNWGHTSPTWLPQHSAAVRHPIVGPAPNSPLGCERAIGPAEEWCVSDVLASTSSDLNPIWDELDHKMKAQKPVQHLWEFLLECWKAIPAEADGGKALSVQSCQQRQRRLLGRLQHIKYTLVSLARACLLYDSICVPSWVWCLQYEYERKKTLNGWVCRRVSLGVPQGLIFGLILFTLCRFPHTVRQGEIDSGETSRLECYWWLLMV